MTGPSDEHRAEARQHVELLTEGAASGWVELRTRDIASGWWQQTFWRPADADALLAAALARRSSHDVYVGVLPRVRRRGRRRDVAERGRVAWVDLDTADGIDRAGAFAVTPSLVVASGTPGHAHAYWRLEQPTALDELERVNRALASVLGGDQASSDPPRILRLAGTLAHKTTPPSCVRIVHCGSGATALADLRDAVHGCLPTSARPPIQHRPAVPAVRRAAYQIDRVTPTVYVEVLTGQAVGRSRKVRCPLHEDRTASLHAYEHAGQGWFCFGCRRGGSIYDLAAAVWQRELRGTAFLDLRRDLQDHFGQRGHLDEPDGRGVRMGGGRAGAGTRSDPDCGTRFARADRVQNESRTGRDHRSGGGPPDEQHQ